MSKKLTIEETQKRIAELEKENFILKEKEKKRKEYFEKDPVELSIWDNQLNLIDTNNSSLFFNAYEDEIFGKNVSEIIADNKIPERYQKYLKLITKENPYCLEEYEYEHPNLGIMILQDFAFKSGEELGVIVTDLTKYIKAEQKTLENEAFIEILTRNYPNSFLSIINKDLEICFTSGEEYANEGVNPEQFKGVGIYEFYKCFDGLEKKIIEENILKAFEGEEVKFEVNKSGYYLRFRIIPFINSKGEIQRVLSISENISEQKETGNKLKKSRIKLAKTEAYLKTLIEKLPFSFWAVDADLNMTIQNEFSRKWWGADVCKNINGISREDVALNKRNEIIKEIVKTNDIVNCEFSISINGKTMILSSVSAPVNSNGEFIGILGIAMDITERKGIEEQFSKLNKKLINLLTPKEKEVLKLLVDGLTSKEIALKQNRSFHTVNNHKKNMMLKLDFNKITDLVRFAVKAGLD